MAITYDAASNTIQVVGQETIADIQAANDANGWGVCTNIGDYYLINANLVVGDGTTGTLLTIDQVMVQIGTVNSLVSWSTTANAEIKFTYFSLIDYPTSGTYAEHYGVLTMINGFWKSNYNQDIWLYGGYTLQNMDIYNITFVQESTGFIDRLTVNHVQFYVFTDTTTFNDIVSSYPIFVDAGKNTVITNSRITHSDYVCSFWLPNSTDFCDVKFIDCKVTNWNASVSSSNQGDYILRQLQTYKTVVTSNGNPINRANVYLEDKNGTIEFNVVTDANGTYPEQIVTQATYTRASGNTPTYYTPHRYRVRKYGYVFIDIIREVNDKIREGTVIKPNPVTTEPDPNVVAGYTGITIDKTNKTITISNPNLTKNMIYDYCQYYCTQNMDVEEILFSLAGNNFTIADGWKVIFETNITGQIAFTGNIYLNSPLNLANMTIEGNLHINTGIDSVLYFNNVIVNGFVYNDDVLHTLTINALSGSSLTAFNPGTGVGQVDIIVLKSFSFTLNPQITNYEWRIYQVNNIGSLDGAVELTGQENATQSTQTYSYNYQGNSIPIAVQIIPQPNNDYEESITYYTLDNNDQNVTINLIPDLNN